MPEENEKIEVDYADLEFLISLAYDGAAESIDMDYDYNRLKKIQNKYLKSK